MRRLAIAPFGLAVALAIPGAATAGEGERAVSVAAGYATDDSTDDSAEPCMTRPSELTPEEEETGWFYRKPVTVRFTEAAPDATFRLYNRDTQAEHGVTVTWNDSDEIATLQADSYLWPSTPYGMDITVCGATYTTTFDTSAYGEPL